MLSESREVYEMRLTKERVNEMWSETQLKLG